MKSKIVLTLASLAFASVAAATEDGFKISGDFASSVFMESGSGKNKGFASTGAISGTENSGDFSVDMAEVVLEKSMGNSGVVLGIGYGRMFDLINASVGTGASAPKSTLNLTNAYFHHKLADTGLSFKLGKFASGVGYESYNYMNNMNYTRAYSFNKMNPWFFTGIAADYTINDMVSVGAVVANSAYNLDTDENQSKHMGVNATVKPMEGLTLKVNYLLGKDGDIPAGGALASAITYQDTTRINATAMYTMGMYDFAFHYSDLSKEPLPSGTKTNAKSMALYAGAKMDVWGAGLRYEMVNDKDGMLFGTADNKMNVITATGWYNVDQNAVLKLEIASTSADKKVFMDKDGAGKDSMSTYGLGFMYRF